MAKINGNGGDDLINGTPDNDALNGSDGNDTIFGMAGNDKIKGEDGNDSLIGGDGNDDIKAGSGDDVASGGEGDDDIQGGSGNDTLFGDPGNDTIDGGSGADVIAGGEGDDEINGGSDDDIVDGGEGNDAIDGGSGDDDLDGGSGEDTIDAGSGNDTVDGGVGNDEIDGGSGDDSIAGGDGDDTIDGGSGDDIVVFNGSVSDFLISISGGALVVTDLTGNGGTDTLDDIEFLEFDDYVFDTDSGANNAPVALVADQTVDEDGDLAVDLTVVDFDGDDVTLPVISVTSDNSTGAPGTITIVGPGSPATGYSGIGSATTFGIQYTPGDGYEFLGTGDTVTETVTVTSTDAFGATFTQSFDIVISGNNDAPVANNDSATVDEDGSVNINVLGNDTDIDNPPEDLSVLTATAANGSVEIEADGTLTYTPDPDYNGPDTITYTMTDGQETSTASVAVTVNPINDAPVAIEDTVTTAPATAININVLANDIDVDNTLQELTVTAATAENGTVVIEEDGTLTYTPNSGFVGVESITYTIADPSGETSSTTVAVSVANPPTGNTAPTALPTTIATTLDESEGASNVLVIDFNTLTVGGRPIISDAEQTIGQLSVTSIQLLLDGRVIAEIVETGPNVFEIDLATLNVGDGATGSFELVYIVDDGQGAANSTASNTITLEVTNSDDGPVNAVPVANDDAITQTEADGEIVISILGEGGLASDADVEDELEITSLTITDEEGNAIDIDLGGESGALVDGVLTLDPVVFGLGDGETGTFLVSYTVSDGQASASGTVTLNLTGSIGNSAPVALSINEVLRDPDDVAPFINSYLIDLNTLVSDIDGDEVTISVTSILDVDDNPLTFTFLDGVITINLFSLETDLGLTAGGSEDLIITYTADDGINAPVTATVNLTVFAEPEDPTGPVTTVLDFENISSDTGSSVVLEQLGDFGFDGTATVIEVDEVVDAGGGRGVPSGLIAGETTIDPPNEGTAATIQGTFSEFDDAGQPIYAFTAYAPGATTSLGDPPIGINTFFQDPSTFFGSGFDLESMSLTALDGPDITVTIITYRYEEVTPGSFLFQYVEAGSFEVTVSSTTALELDFFSGQFIDDITFEFDDPETVEIETSAFDNIVAVQFVTTGVLLPPDRNDPEAEAQPINDDVLVIDDFVFTL